MYPPVFSTVPDTLQVLSKCLLGRRGKGRERGKKGEGSYGGKEEKGEGRGEKEGKGGRKDSLVSEYLRN